jgi:REP element-mobilizing transposase RayT
MPRKALEVSTLLPYHVTARTNNRAAFPLKHAILWDLFTEECLFVHMVHQAEFQAVVLMPNHFHLILTTPNGNLGSVMNELMKSVSRRVNQLSGRSGHLWGGPYHWSMIGESRYFGHALKYVHRNPVKAGLCDRVEAYPFGTIRGLVGESHLPVPLFETRLGLEVALPSLDPVEQLPWLNTPFPIEVQSKIQLGLRKKIFRRSIDRRTRRPDSALECLI